MRSAWKMLLQGVTKLTAKEAKTVGRKNTELNQQGWKRWAVFFGRPKHKLVDYSQSQTSLLYTPFSSKHLMDHKRTSNSRCDGAKLFTAPFIPKSRVPSSASSHQIQVHLRAYSHVRYSSTWHTTAEEKGCTHTYILADLDELFNRCQT